MSTHNDFSTTVAEPQREEFARKTYPKWNNARFFLWAHLVSQHAIILDIDCSMDELRDLHEAEHTGPGTIRNHPQEDRSYSLKKLGRVLSEADR